MGRRVILAHHVGSFGRDAGTAHFSLLTYLLESGSDRIGALDFQASASEYLPRRRSATLEEVQRPTDTILGRG